VFELLLQFTNVKLEDEKEGENQKIETISLKKKMKNATEDDWKELCISNFDFIKEKF